MDKIEETVNQLVNHEITKSQAIRTLKDIYNRSIKNGGGFISKIRGIKCESLSSFPYNKCIIEIESNNNTCTTVDSLKSDLDIEEGSTIDIIRYYG